MPLGALGLLVSIGLAVSTMQDAPPGSTWRLPDEALGVRMAPILLLSRPDIQIELAILPEQAEAAREAIIRLYAEAASLRGQSGPEAVEARRAVDENARRWIDDHLSIGQRTRLEQLDLQWEGAAALISRPTIGASLDLSDDQRRRLTELVAQRDEPGAGPIDLHRRRHRDAASILTDDQRHRWLAMLGPPFELGAPRPSVPVASGR